MSELKLDGVRAIFADLADGLRGPDEAAQLEAKAACSSSPAKAG